MKRRFEIYNESGFDENGYPVRTVVKAFKNEPEAMAFYYDKRNNRRYSSMSMQMHVADGTCMMWDDRRKEWVTT